MIKVIGLTGRSGSGKGYVSKRFADLGIDSIDTDKVAREVVGPGSECLKELADHFGDDILDSDGTLKRRTLASAAFSSAEKTAALNRITHKYILKRTAELIAEAENNGKSAVIVDAPQLFESGFDKCCGVIVGVIADDELCLERIIKRDGLSREEAEKRLSRQHGNDFFIANCDHIIVNDDITDIPEAVGRLAEIILSDTGENTGGKSEK